MNASHYRHFAAGVASAYGLLATNILFTLASVPLALHYLDKEEFGMWVFIVQVVGLLQLVEMGVSGAFSRLIIDHKDDAEGAAYSRMCGAAWLILSVQGLLIFATGVAVGHLFGPALGIGDDLLGQFSILLALQSLIVGFGYALRIFYLLLFAHHRIAVTNICQIGALAITLGMQWLFFHLGKGLFALPIAAACASAFFILVGHLACRRLGILPRQWLRPSRGDFVAVLKFGSSIFLIHISSQFIWAGQLIILTKAIGLEAAAVWAVCTRPFVLIAQVGWRPIDLAFTFFSELASKDERDRLWTRYRDVGGIAMIVIAIGAVGYAACNPAFVEVWTQGKISWSPLNNLLVAAWLIPLTVTRCGNVLIQATKEIRMLRTVYVAEAALFLVAGYAAAGAAGIAAMVMVFIACTVLLTASYTVWRAARYFDISIGLVAKALLLPALPIVAASGACALTATWLTRGLATHWQLALNAAAVIAGGLAVLRIAMSRELKAAIMGKVPARFVALAGLVLGTTRANA